MGNTVSAAELAASQIVHSQIQVENVNEKFDHLTLSSKKIHIGDIPPECPMHQKNFDQQAVKVVPEEKRLEGGSECPVQGEEINLLNMVRLINILHIVIYSEIF